MSVKIDYSRDSLLDEFAHATLKDRYMIPGETSPQEAFARAAPKRRLALANLQIDYEVITDTEDPEEASRIQETIQQMTSKYFKKNTKNSLKTNH